MSHNLFLGFLIEKIVFVALSYNLFRLNSKTILDLFRFETVSQEYM